MSYALLIDDDPGLVASIQRLVGLADLAVLTATSWDEGLAMFEIYSPLLVIADYNLPGSKHGLRLLAEIRRLNPAVRLVIVSAFIGEDDLPGIEATGLVDRALTKLSLTTVSDAIVDEVEAAKNRSDEPTNWVDYAQSFGRAREISAATLDEIDNKLRARPGID